MDIPDWIPGAIIPADRKVALKIGFGEIELGQKVKSASANWNPDQKAWMLSYRQVLQSGMACRVIDPKVDL